MIGCKYCRMEENGDFGPDLTPLLLMEQCWRPGKDVKTVSMNGIERTKSTIPTQLMEVTVFDNRLQICFNGEFEFEREIKYCPMCGRELKNMEVEQ